MDIFILCQIWEAQRNLSHAFLNWPTIDSSSRSFRYFNNRYIDSDSILRFSKRNLNIATVSRETRRDSRRSFAFVSLFIFPSELSLPKINFAREASPRIFRRSLVTWVPRLRLFCAGIYATRIFSRSAIRFCIRPLLVRILFARFPRFYRGIAAKATLTYDYLQVRQIFNI